MSIDQSQIIKFIQRRKYRPMDAYQLAGELAVSGAEYDDFCASLHNLELQGEIVKVKNNQYARPKKVGLLVGTLECKPKGFGFVIPVKGDGQEDVYVDEEDMSEAMHGDIVVVRLPKKTGGKKKKRGQKKGSGKIVEVLYHANETIVGIFKRGERLNYVVPDNPSLFRDIYVADKDVNGATQNDKVIVKVVQWPSKHLNPEGVINKVLGKEGSSGVDVQSVIHQFRLPHIFNEDTKMELAEIQESIPLEEYKRRLDLREVDIITIDPEDAKDFDDAVSLEMRDDKWFLGVHIADVSFYVRPGSNLDKEAQTRGNSVYFPGAVIPMLPDKLSNGICSLKEGEDRLTKSVLVTFDNEGNLLDSEIKYSIIRVKRRFNYNEVTRLLEALEEYKEAINLGLYDTIAELPLLKKEYRGRVSSQILKLFLNMKSLALLLFKNRLIHGSIELDIPEVELKLDEDENIVRVEKGVKDISHRIIEEFMLVANEAVATMAKKNKLPCLYRIHPEPDAEDMFDFAHFIKGIKRKSIDPFDRKQLQRILDDVAGKPEAYAVNHILLRSFKQAEYSPSQESHFALAMVNYTHFTSPIRRYPDLLVHRSIDRHLSNKSGLDRFPISKDNLKELAGHCSFTERRADEAEREIIKMKLIRYIEKYVDQEMEGFITGVEEYGFFVQLRENLLEGLVHVRTLTDDFYRLDKKNFSLKGTKRGNIYRIGDRVKVKICNIDRLKKQVDFKVI